MKRYLMGLPLALVLCGAAMNFSGQFSKSEITPLGHMDCGSGGGTECVTKERAVSAGLGMTTVGGALCAIGLFGGSVQIYRRVRASA